MESKEEVRLRQLLRKRMALILYKNDTIPNETVFNSLTTAIFEHRHFRSGTTRQWTFPGAFYFSTLVVTLIGKFNMKLRFCFLIKIFFWYLGYGQTTPKTSMIFFPL